MAQEQAKRLLQQGIAAARSNRPGEARDLLQQAVRLDPQNETIWLWLSSVAVDDKERLFCLKQLLALNPQNEFALKGLRALGAEPVETTQETPATSVPVLSDEKYGRAQQAIEDFLRRYSPEPPRKLDIQWKRKLKRRYNEGGAARLRRITYATAVLAALAVVAIVAVLAVLGVGSLGGSKATPVAEALTRVLTSTPTPTLTPTPGGPTPTPFPVVMAVPPTQIPTGIARGSEYGNEPTPIYPPVDPNVANLISGAIDLYSVGEYAAAIEIFAAEHEASGSHCYPSIIYYEAVSYAEQGGFANLSRASQLLEEALAYQPPSPRYSSCQNDALILAGLGYVRWLQGNPAEALSLSEQALSIDSRVVQAALTKAQAEFDQGQLASARLTVAQALNAWPEDTNLLVLAARVEMADGQILRALDYIGTALYIEPAMQPALQLQAQIYLILASQTPATDDVARAQYYGLAVRSAQTLSLYYSGDPAGYLYLAQARIGEGNDDAALTALTRIIEADEELSENTAAASVVEEAYRVRAGLYYRQGWLAEAQADLEEVVKRDQTDEQSWNTLVAVTMANGDYAEARNHLDYLLSIDPDNSAYILQQAQILVEICTYTDDIACQYSDMLELLDDAFIAGLDTTQRASAYVYRAQAKYWETKQSRSLSVQARRTAYEAALDDIDQALSERDSAIARYYRGLVRQELRLLIPALDDFYWVAYWNTWYTYPFVTPDLEDQIAGLIEEMEAGTAEATEEPEETPEATVGPSPSPTPRATATPSPTPTPAPPTATPPQLP